MRSVGRRWLARLALVAAALGEGAVPVSAHPHIWIKARAEIVFDGTAKLAAIRQSWTFDQAYSAYMVLNLDSNHDGKPDPAKLADLARTNLASLKDYNWFTAAKANGKPIAFGEPEQARQTFADGRLQLDFVLPLTTPIAPPKIMVLTIDDPSFFVSFSFASAADSIRLVGPETGCALNVNRPAQTAEEGKQIVPDDIAATAAPAAGTEYVTRAILACP